MTAPIVPQWRLDALAILRRNLDEAMRSPLTLVESQNWWGNTILDCQAVGIGFEAVAPLLTEIMVEGVQMHGYRASARASDLANRAAEERLIDPRQSAAPQPSPAQSSRGLFNEPS